MVPTLPLPTAPSASPAPVERSPAALRLGQLLTLVVAYMSEYAPDRDGEATLHALALTSSTIAHAAQRALFRHLRISSSSAIGDLVSAVDAEPSLAQAAVALRIDMGREASRGRAAPGGSMRQLSWDELRELFGSEFEMDGGRIAGLRADDVEALAPVLRQISRLALAAGAAMAANGVLLSLGHAPRLIEVTISLADHYASPAGQDFPYHIPAFGWPGPAYEHLQVMRFDSIAIFDLAPFGRAPSLRTLTFRDCSFPPDPQPTLQPTASQLRDLRFNSCSNVPLADVVALLRQLGPQLLRFEMERTAYSNPRGTLADADTEDVRMGLAACSRLERLVWVERLRQPDAAPTREAFDVSLVLGDLARTLRSVTLAPPLNAGFDQWLDFVTSRDRPLVEITLHRLPHVRRKGRALELEQLQYLWWRSPAGYDGAAGLKLVGRNEPSELKHRVWDVNWMVDWTSEEVEHLATAAESMGRRLVGLIGETCRERIP